MRLETMYLEQSGAVATITLNRPERLNAINQQWLADLTQLLSVIRENDEVRAVVLTGAGDHFCAGADLKALNYPRTSMESYQFLQKVQATMGLLESLEKATVAAVRGYALGGGTELALHCDLIVAADDAVFGVPEILAGVLPGAGGLARLPKLVGAQKAKELVMLGRRIPASEARTLGFVAETVPSAEAVPRAQAVAAELATRPPLAIAVAKRLLNVAHDLPLRDGLDLEAKTGAVIFGTADQMEGIRAFNEKRKPVFRGR